LSSRLGGTLSHQRSFSGKSTVAQQPPNGVVADADRNRYVAELRASRWQLMAEPGWYILAEDHWHIIDEHRSHIIARTLTPAAGANPCR
jgi:hypothetical protein